MWGISIMLDKKYTGWIQAFALVFILWGLSNIILSFITQVLDLNKLIFTGSNFLSCSLCLLVYSGHGKLSRETFRSVDTWLFGIMMLANYFVALNLFALLTPTEVTLLQRLSVIFSIFISWFFFLRKPSKPQVLGLLLIIVGVILVASGISKEISLQVYTLMILGGIAQSLRVFMAETHKTHKKATEDTSIKSRCRVIGYVMFVVSLLFWSLLVFMAWVSHVYQQPLLIDIQFKDFLSYQSILFGLLMGVIIYAPTRYLEFSSAEKIKTENFLAVGALSFFATWIWQFVLADFLNIKTTSFDGDDILAGALITIGALVMAIGKMYGANKEMNFGKYLSYSPQDPETVDETREIIANSLEHFDSDVKRTAKALDIPSKVIDAIFEDKSKILAFNDKYLRLIAKRYRKNVAAADSLTGLLNKAGFKTALKAASLEADTMSLYFIDLNKFKPVNDTYGHSAGDYVLQVVADRLRELFPNKSLITRLGGDEYCILLLGVTKKQALMKIKSISKVLEEEIVYNEHKINISGSIGMANFPEDANNMDDLIEIADKQMYVEKDYR